ncbi:MAG TPA: GTPase HflX [Clostridiaceae bacterium]|nr:GTPase HflX [Clostridiaceae bacterium]
MNKKIRDTNTSMEELAAQQTGRAILVAVDLRPSDIERVERSLDELEDLAKTNGFTIVDRIVQRLDRIDRNTFVGSGKLQDIVERAEEINADFLIFDGELSPAQTRGITQVTDLKVSDRVSVILSIFADHARTDEGKIQVELAYLRYRLTQLVGRGAELSRLGGGIGTRGPGETVLEQDRRAIRKRMGVLRRELKRMEERRERSRSLRDRRHVMTAAIVGYTNAGKSTLLNILCDETLDAGDQLFMTLDPTARRLDIREGLSLILVDTVGFIRDLPTFLYQAFRATFEEAASADLILLVTDISDPDAAMHIEVVQKQLKDLDAGSIPVLYLLNKSDCVRHESLHDVMMMLRNEKASQIIEISAKTGQGLDRLLSSLAHFVEDTYLEYRAVLPYKEAGLVAHAREYGTVDVEQYESDAIILEGKIRKNEVGPLKSWIVHEP